MSNVSQAVMEAIEALYGLDAASGLVAAALEPFLVAIELRPNGGLTTSSLRVLHREVERLTRQHNVEFDEFSRVVIERAFAGFDAGYTLLMTVLASAGGHTVTTNSAAAATRELGARLLRARADDPATFRLALFELPALLIAHDLVEPQPARSYLDRVRDCTRAVVEDSFPSLAAEATIRYIQASFPDHDRPPTRRQLIGMGAAVLAQRFESTFDAYREASQLGGYLDSRDEALLQLVVVDQAEHLHLQPDDGEGQTSETGRRIETLDQFLDQVAGYIVEDDPRLAARRPRDPRRARDAFLGSLLEAFAVNAFDDFDLDGHGHLTDWPHVAAALELIARDDPWLLWSVLGTAHDRLRLSCHLIHAIAAPGTKPR